ncbi:MAG TPA: alpha/beta hydrolase, partial [Dongiaceae bacterium]|nr:alpha/beta hydrolase [Dongiaceae bacterium]
MSQTKPMNPALKAMIDAIFPADGPDWRSMPAAAYRKALQETRVPDPPYPLPRIEDVKVAGAGGPIAARFYAPSREKGLPCILYIHGGGWVICDLDSHDLLARALAKESGCAVLSVDYRLAPEHPFPAGLMDCRAALLWLRDRGASLDLDGSRLAVAGDSAGGNLAAALCLLMRDEAPKLIRHQALIYPVTDNNFDRPSYLDYADEYGLTRDEMIWFWQHYLAKPQDADDPHVAILRAPDLSNLPPATVTSAEFDVLRDEGEAYAERLRQAGNQVTLHRVA